MALHMTGLASRHNLAHPDEKPAVKPVFAKVLKFNPHHGVDGKFASGTRKGGTEGPPQEDAFGNPLKSRRGGPAGGRFASDKTGVAPHVQELQYAKSHLHGTSDGGYGPKGGNIEDGSIRSAAAPRPSPPYAAPQDTTVPAEQKVKNYKTMFGSHPGSLDASGTPTKRSSFS